MSISNFLGENTILLTSISIISSAIAVMIYNIMGVRQNRKFYSRYNSMRLYYERQMYDLQQKLVNTSEKWSDTYQLYLTEARKNEENVAFPYIPDLKNHRFFSALGIDRKKMDIDRNLAFVLTPFHDDFFEIYFQTQRVCHSLGLRCLRGDEEHIDGDLLPHIVKYILSASVIICILDGRNPNVMYELGLAHAFDKYVILIASGVEEANSLVDIKSNKVVIFHNERDLSEQLYAALARVFKSRLAEGASS